MKKNTLAGSAIVASMIVGLSGCGGSSSSASIGTGHYLDSAVSGINYKCGSEEGITDANGVFTFEKGESCTFYLGDIKLRGVASTNLVDGGNMVETDVQIAQLLQTLDTDGNPSNGITISPKVVEALATAINVDGGDGSLPDTMEKLEALSAELKDVSGYTGHAVSADDAQTHLTVTQTEVTKELFAGKTFYVVGNDDDGWELYKIQVNSDATKLTGPDGSEDVTIIGNKMTSNDKNNGSYALIIQKSDYIYFENHNADGSIGYIKHYSFTDKAKAQAFLKTKQTTNTNNLKALLAGKTLYKPEVHDGKAAITTFKFNNEMTSIHASANGSSQDFHIQIQGDGFNFDGFRRYQVASQNSGYIVMDYFQDGEKKETYRFYYDKTKAEENLNNL